MTRYDPFNEQEGVMTFVQTMMAVTGVCYAVTAFAWYAEGKTWMAATFVLYAGACLTMYFAGHE